MKHVWLSEWKMVTRQKSYYSLIVLWFLVFSLLFLLQSNYGGIAGYTNVTATIANIILYLLPLFMLITGSFSISGEIENGQWHLLSTYPINIPSYLIGKVVGLFIAQTVIFTFSFGISMAIGFLFQIPLSIPLLLSIYMFSILLIFIFLLMGIMLGSIVSTRWKALMVSVGVWFFLIMIWPTALIAILGLFPYSMISPLMKLALFINPAEFLRFFFVVRWGSGVVFGESYYSLTELFALKNSWIIIVEYFIAYVAVILFLSFLLLKRRQLK
ncbi:ABC transporter permease [Fervidibacillus albus]|uniref:ABC transporter permease n=1 Tax=Fervidibacillus albus TaxID=2980026 RepID=A0A9E8LSE7_9BACI|nr:ABC transporter permease subunit [Fervidibacillus albus]WAA08742.1 ABC transporter permease [Fervidibacillus albus]